MKIPKQAKRVFKGEIFEVWQWQQKMFDGSFAVYERIKRPDSVQIIPTYNGKIVIPHEEQPHFSRLFGLFGGRLDEGEEALLGAKRELLEETGFVSDDWELLKTNEPYRWVEYQSHLFAARNCRKVAEPKPDAGERIEIREVSFEEFIEITSSEEFRNKILAADVLRMRLDKHKFVAFKQKILR